jgi:hypothetical protein
MRMQYVSERRGRRGVAETGAGHRQSLGLAEAIKLQHLCGSARCKGASQRERRAGLLAQAGEQQHGVARHVVDEVLDNSERLRIRPLQVLKDQRNTGPGCLMSEHLEQSKHGLTQVDE